MYTVRKAQREHISFVKNNIRQDDMERRGLTREQYRRALKLSIENSDEIFAWVKDGKAHAIGGFKYNLESLKTSVWAVTTPLTDNHAKDVIKAGRDFIDSFRGHELYALIDPEDERVVKLVEAIGFKPSVQIAPNKQFFNKE